MRFLRLELSGYIGIYNGLGKSKIEIDFTKCKYNKIIIKGLNGSGKSTIEKAMNPLPDSNSFFVPGMVAKKLAIIQDGNIIYKIEYIHGVKNNGDRDTSKGYIKRIVGDEVTELNPNGNISSCKEAIYNEFNLDPNFLALSTLSSEDRGLADKKPTERKKFVSAIISSLSTYNDIYKVLSKKSSIFKATINSLIYKIDSIGDEEKLKFTLTSLENRINNYQAEKEKIISEIATYKYDIQRMDPDGSIQNEYNDLINSQSSIIKEIELMRSQINTILNELNIEDMSKSKEFFDIIISERIAIESNIQSINNSIETLLINREEESKQLQTKIQKLNSLTSEFNYKDIQKKISELNSNISQYESIFKQIGLDDATILTKDEYVIGLNTLKDIKDTVDVFRDSVEYGVIEETITNFINQGIDPAIQIQVVNNEITNLKNQIEQSKLEIMRLEGLLQATEDLKFRPSNCKIDSCKFIKGALEAARQEPEEQLKIQNGILEGCKVDLKSKEDNLEYLNKIIYCVNYINILTRNINNYKSILKKLPNGYIFSDKDVFLQKLVNGNNFEEINVLYSYLNCANMIEEYKVAKDMLYKLNIENKIYESKNDRIIEIQEDINNLTEKTNELSNKLTEKYNELEDSKYRLAELSLKETKFKTLNNLLEAFEKLNKSNQEITDRFNTIKSDMIKINDNITMINSLQNRINDINLSLQPLSEEKDKLKHASALLVEYRAELKEYQSKFDIVETIKYYSSPTKGIQNVFMEIYLNKIIDMSNRLLMLLFNGEFVLQPFIITADEFRMPCKGEGIMNDDISSMSTAQICMISMILSFTLLYQSSTKYNIIHLDEIDGGLDTSNRLNFTIVLDEVMRMLNCEQCVIVSHNNEIDTEQADIILLKNEGLDFVPGNVIYEYGKD